MKHILRTALLLMLCLTLYCCLIPAAHAEGIIDSGTCGTDLTWTLYDTGELVINGTGAMADYDYDQAPWYANCEKITSVVIRDGVTTIGGWAFDCCSSLTSVTIPASVTSIGEGAFDGCSSLTSVTIPKGVPSIGNWTFDSCSSLTSVTIPASVTSIGDYAFCDCSSLTSVTIPEGVTIIGESAFWDCSSLTSVTIPESMEYIDSSAFCGCDNLEDVYYSGTKEQWEAIGIDVDNDPLHNATIHYGTAPDFILPDSLTTIEAEAFEGGAFRYVQLPEGVTSIGSRAFADCPNLAYIYIPEETDTIARDAFEGVSGLTILGHSGSYAEVYAQRNGIAFIAVE